MYYLTPTVFWLTIFTQEKWISCLPFIFKTKT